MIMPSFYIIGPQRTSTSWIHRIFESYSCISLPLGVKETFFFDKFYSGDLNCYEAMFSSSPTKLRGEVAPTYFDSDQALDLISNYYPSSVIISIIRDPVERCLSLHHHEYSKGRCDKNFFDAIKSYPYLLSSGIYSDRIPLWKDAFGDKLRLFEMSSIVQDPESFIADFFALFDLPYVAPATPRLLNPYGSKVDPRFGFLSASAVKLAGFLRTNSFHSPVNLLKRCGAKNIFFKRPKPSCEDAQTAFLVDYFRFEYEYLYSIGFFLPRFH